MLAASVPSFAMADIKRIGSFYDLNPRFVVAVLRKAAYSKRLYLPDDRATRKQTAFVVVEDVPFDTDHFGKHVMRLSYCYSGRDPSLSMDGLLSKVMSKSRRMGVDCLYARVNLEDIATIHALEKAGFQLMDALQTLKLDLDDSLETRSSKSVRPFRKSDIPRIAQIARETYTPSRFFRDRHFPEQLARAYYAKWARNCCSGLAENVLVVQSRGVVCGFITVRRITQREHAFYGKGGIIDLVRVHPGYQSRGFGAQLTKSAIAWFRKSGVRFVLIGTEANNLPALNCYVEQGFRVQSASATFHYWT